MVNAANFPYVYGGGHEQPSSFTPIALPKPKHRSTTLDLAVSMRLSTLGAFPPPRRLIAESPAPHGRRINHLAE